MLPIMGKQAKRAYLEAIRGRYRKSKPSGKTEILGEFCAVCGYNRKYETRLLGRKKSTSQPRRAGRKSKYTHPQLIEALGRIWLSSDQLCSKRLKVALPFWSPHYETEYGVLVPGVKSGLLAASASTLDRLLRPVRIEHPKRTARRVRRKLSHCVNGLGYSEFCVNCCFSGELLDTDSVGLL